jgi:hypothetical protein
MHGSRHYCNAANPQWDQELRRAQSFFPRRFAAFCSHPIHLCTKKSEDASLVGSARDQPSRESLLDRSRNERARPPCPNQLQALEQVVSGLAAHRLVRIQARAQHNYRRNRRTRESILANPPRGERVRKRRLSDQKDYRRYHDQHHNKTTPKTSDTGDHPAYREKAYAPGVRSETGEQLQRKQHAPEGNPDGTPLKEPRNQDPARGSSPGIRSLGGAQLARLTIVMQMNGG